MIGSLVAELSEVCSGGAGGTSQPARAKIASNSNFLMECLFIAQLERRAIKAALR
jgi:hypothetical protein